MEISKYTNKNNNDNNDPEGLGRVKVQFNWAGGNHSSEWIRMIQPHSDSGKGFYVIPEIDDCFGEALDSFFKKNPKVSKTPSEWVLIFQLMKMKY